MDVAGYTSISSIFSGSIGTIAVPLLGAGAGSLGFTQGQVDAADAALITVSTGDINIVYGTGATPGTGATGGHLVPANTSLFIRGNLTISQLRFIARGATSGQLAVTLFGGR